MENINWGHLLFKFDGRINRGKFWLATAAMWVVMAIYFTIAFVVNEPALWTFAVVIYIGVLWVGLAVSIKRWHDRDKSGWWVLIGLVPVIGGLWALIETGFLEGTKGDNQYGPDPLAS